MSRVNHKKVKQLMAEKRNKITDRQFFTSRALAGHFEDIAAAQTKRFRYNRRVRVQLFWKPKDQFLAATNNKIIRINTGHKLVTGVKGREDRYKIVCGLFAHELGHVLYTDFLVNQTYTNSLGTCRWFPEAPVLYRSEDIRNESDIWDYMYASEENKNLVIMTAHQISNVLEDGYIENRILNEFPGTLGMGLLAMRDLHYKEIPTVTQMIEQEEDGTKHIMSNIFQLILSYAKYGEIKYGEEPFSDPRIQTVFSLITEIDRAVATKSAKERLSIVNLILIQCWEYVKDFCEVCKQTQKEADASGSGDTGNSSEILSSILGSMAGNSSISEGDSASVDGSESVDGVIGNYNSRSRNKTHKDADSGAESEEEDNNPSGSDSASTGLSESGTMLNSSAGEASQKQEIISDEDGRIPFMQTEEASEPVGGEIEYDEDYKREAYDRAAADIERVLEQIAEKSACEELENERLQALNEAAQNISYGNIHRGVNIRVNRIASIDEELVEQYDAVCAPLLVIARQLQRSVTKQLQDQRRGGKQTGLLMGRRLDSHALHRQDGKWFSKNNLPQESPEIAVGLLLDESGSMHSCDRCTYARATAIIVYEFCRGLDIPVMVYGHSTGYSKGKDSVELYSYAEFDSIDRDDKYRMMDISARGSNRDGAALRFVAEQLTKRAEPVKLLFIVSDGQPADTGYYGTAAEEDLRGIKQEYQRKGVTLIAAAIGNDRQNIERIYGDSYLDITDLNQLPMKLTNLIKRHIKM